MWVEFALFDAVFRLLVHGTKNTFFCKNSGASQIWQCRFRSPWSFNDGLEHTHVTLRSVAIWRCTLDRISLSGVKICPITFLMFRYVKSRTTFVGDSNSNMFCIEKAYLCFESYFMKDIYTYTHRLWTFDCRQPSRSTLWRLHWSVVSRLACWYKWRPRTSFLPKQRSRWLQQPNQRQPQRRSLQRPRRVLLAPPRRRR